MRKKRKDKKKGKRWRLTKRWEPINGWRQLHGPFCPYDPFSHQNPVPSEQAKQNIPRKLAVKRSVPRASGAFIRPFSLLFTVNPLFPDFHVLRRMCDKQIDVEISPGDSTTTGPWSFDDKGVRVQTVSRKTGEWVRFVISKSISISLERADRCHVRLSILHTVD